MGGPTSAETALYYFFSSIAQALPTAFGVLGAFAAFRLQLLRGHIERIVSTIRDRFLARKNELNLNDPAACIEASCIDDVMLDLANHHIPSVDFAFSQILDMHPIERRFDFSVTAYPDVEHLLTSIEILEAGRTRLRDHTLAALKATVPVVVAALAGLGFARWVSIRFTATATVYLVGVIAVGFVLSRYYAVIRESLKAGPMGDYRRFDWTPSTELLRGTPDAPIGVTGHLREVIWFLQVRGANPLRRWLAPLLSDRAGKGPGRRGIRSWGEEED